MTLISLAFKSNLIMEPESSPTPVRKKKVNKWVEETPPSIPSIEQQRMEQQPGNNTLKKQPISGSKHSINKISQKYKIDMGSMIGSGFASNVYLGRRVTSTSQTPEVCLKAIDLLSLSASSSDHATFIQQEIKAMQKFNSSQFIVNLYDVYQSPTFLYLVMELCPGGDLYKFLKVTTFRMPLPITQSVIKQVCLGLREIHSAGYIHRDLKTENIFIVSYPQQPEDSMRVKIGDLGFCVSKEALLEIKRSKKKVVNLGSPIYMSPETATHQEYSEASDIYALGIIWYELLHRRAPWEARTEAELQHKKLFDQVTSWREDIPQTTKDIILQCLHKQVNKRPSSSQIIEFLEHRSDPREEQKLGTNQPEKGLQNTEKNSQ